MKKFLSIAIAAAVAAPLAVNADTTIYGKIANELVHTDLTGGANSWDVENNTSRFGVKGDEDLGNGLKAIFQYEWAVDSSDAGTFDGRLAYVGLTGGFGTVAIGRQWTPYYGTVDKTDIMQTNGMNDHYIGLTRVGNAVAYVSPNFNGFVAKVALILDGAAGDDSVDATNISLDYNNGPISVGASILDYSDDASATGDRWGIAGKYNFGNFAIIGQYEDQDDINLDEASIAAEAYFGNNTVRAVYGTKDNNGTDQDQWAIGVSHDFSKRTRVYVEYQDTEDNAGDETGVDASRFGIGLRHNF